jgi:hypothetical protein
MQKMIWVLALTSICQFSSNSYAALTKDDDNTIKISTQEKADARFKAGSVIALNLPLHLDGVYLERGTELIIDNEGNLSQIVFDSKNKSPSEVLKHAINIKELYAYEYTVLNQDEETGEISPYNLPNDFDIAGPMKVRSKRNGVTNCYHVVKALVKDRIELYGVAAYMAAPQLKEAGWHRYADYDSAPEGSVCVFNKGGIVTTSGGHIYGHIGVKGASGIANPTSGFHLNRPFLGCWNEV